MAGGKVRHSPTFVPKVRPSSSRSVRSQRPDSRSSVRSLAQKHAIAQSEERLMQQSGMRDGTFDIGVTFQDEAGRRPPQSGLSQDHRPSTANKFVDEFLAKESTDQRKPSSTRMLKQLQEARQLHSSSGRVSSSRGRLPSSASGRRPMTGNKYVDAYLTGSRPRTGKRPSTAGSVRPNSARPDSSSSTRVSTTASRPATSNRRPLSRAGVIGTLRPWSRTSRRSDILVVHGDDDRVEPEDFSAAPDQQQYHDENSDVDPDHLEAGQQSSPLNQDDHMLNEDNQENDASPENEDLTEEERFRREQMKVNGDNDPNLQNRFVYNSKERVQRAHDAVDRLTDLFNGTVRYQDKQRSQEQMRGSLRLGTNYGRDTPTSDSPANRDRFQTTKDTFDTEVQKTRKPDIPPVKPVRNSTSSGMLGALSPRILERDRREAEQGHTLDVSDLQPNIHNPWKTSLAHKKSLRHTAHHKGTYETEGSRLGAHAGVPRKELSVYHHAKANNNVELARAPEDRIPVRSESAASFSDPMDYGLDLRNPVVNNGLWESSTFW